MVCSGNAPFSPHSGAAAPSRRPDTVRLHAEARVARNMAPAPPLDLTSHTRNSRGILWCTGGVIGLRGQAPATTLPLCIIGPLTAYLDEKVWASVLKR